MTRASRVWRRGLPVSRKLPSADRRGGLIGLLLLLPLLLAVLGLVTAVVWGDDETWIPEPTGQRTSKGLCLAIAADVSGSTRATDPKRRAWTATRRAMAFLRDHAKGERDYVAVYHFGGAVGLELPPVPLVDGWRLVEQALTHPGRTLGGTDFVPVLDAVRRGLSACPPDARPFVVLMTDGRPSAEGTGEFERIQAAVDALPVAHEHIHVMALDEGGQWDLVRGFWESLGFGSTTRISGLEEGELEEKLGRLLVAELGMQWGGTDP